MARKLNLIVVATSAPHFPMNKAGDSYRACLMILKGNFDFNFYHLDRVITDTISFESELRELKEHDPDGLVLIQGAFTWDDISIYLHEYFGKIPTILWAIPEGEFSSGVLETNSLCGAIMNNAAFHKLGYLNLFCYGSPWDERVKERVTDALKAVECAARVRKARYGMVGYRPTGFFSSTFDEMKIRAELGIETVYYDLAALLDDMQDIPGESIVQDVGNAKRLGMIGEADEESLREGSRVYLSLKNFIDRERVDFVGVRCWPEMMKRGVNPCMVLGRLADEGIPAACESDFGGALSMAIATWVSDETAWLADLTHLNEKNSSFYFWHCGAAPASLAHAGESPVINKQFRGLDRGNTLEFILKEGEVTVSRFGITNSQYRLFAFKGRAVLPDVRIKGNLSEIVPEMTPRSIFKEIIENGIEHHLAVAYGNLIDKLRNVARLIGVKFGSV